MRFAKPGRALAAVGIVTALVAAGCGSGGDDGGSGKTDGTVSIQWGEPENPLIPGNTTEVQGGKVMDALFTGLISYSPKDASQVLEMAESITPDATSTTYTIKIKSGWTFHDGSPVKAKSFTDAWNYYAYSPNGMANGPFFADIAGFSDTYTEDPDADGPKKAPTPKAKEMSGLKVVDDTTFTVTLGAPSTLWPLKTGYSVFMPLPQAFFDNGPEAYAKEPIGNGPFKFSARKVNTSLTITRFDGYKGREKPKVKDVVFKVYQKDTAAYADAQDNQVDFVQQVPTSALTGDKYKSDFPNQSLNKPVAVSQFIAFPFYRPEYKNPKLRQAISMSIDRKLITEKIFNNSRVPMNGWVNPNVSGFEEGACGEFCTYNPTKAKALLAEAGGFKGEFSIAYNADSNHKSWVEAACNSITGAIGVKCAGKAIPTFDAFRTLVDDRKQTSMFRAGWQADYPSIENWLNPLLRTGASSNDGLFTDAAFDAKLKEADGTQDIKKAEALYRDAEKMLPALMPTIPLWHVGQQSVWSNKVSNIVIDAFGEIALSEITVK